MKRFYVRRGLRLDGSSFWYVIKCYTRRLASKAKFKSRSAAEARRAQLQAKFERQAVLRFLSWGEK